MQITVRLGEPIRRLAGSILVPLEFDAEQVSVADVLARLIASYAGFEAALRGDDLGRPSPYQIFINARRVPAGGEAHTLLAPGDKVYIFLPAVGGVTRNSVAIRASTNGPHWRSRAICWAHPGACGGWTAPGRPHLRGGGLCG
jgi:molybdopterin converting factor small subunit